MPARPVWLLVPLAVAVGCSASHPADGPDTASADAAPFDGGGGTEDGGAVDAPAIADGGRRDVGGAGDECDGPSQCVLRPASCCGSCGAATPEDMVALSLTELDAYVAEVCMDVGCPECAREPDPYLLATCTGSACVAVDLHADVRTECGASSDCTLAPAHCCACGLLAQSEVIAFNPANGSIGSLTCDPDADCPPCVPDFGALTAVCTSGRCEVRAP